MHDLSHQDKPDAVVERLNARDVFLSIRQAAIQFVDSSCHLSVKRREVRRKRVVEQVDFLLRVELFVCHIFIVPFAICAQHFFLVGAFFLYL